MDNKKYNFFFEKFDYVTSFGYRCYTKAFIDKYICKKETEIFDWLGSHVCYINDLISNDFDGFVDKQNFAILNNNTAVKKNMYNTKYYTNFYHDFEGEMLNKIDDEVLWKNFFDKYTRRIERFKNNFNNSKNILIIREEFEKKKAKSNNFNKKIFLQSEYKYLIELSKILKNKFSNANCYILFLSKNEKTNYNKEYNIITINCDINCRYGLSADFINEIMIKNTDFLLNISI